MRYVPASIFESLKDEVGIRCTATTGQPCEELHGIESILNDGSKVLLCHAVDKKGKDLVDAKKLSYPKSLENKADYLYVKDFFDKKEWQSDYQSLLDNRMKWVNTGKPNNPKEGITDDLHEIREVEGTEGTEYYQYEYQEDPNCKMFRLGFTIAEVERIIGEVEGIIGEEKQI